MSKLITFKNLIESNKAGDNYGRPIVVSRIIASVNPIEQGIAGSREVVRKRASDFACRINAAAAL